MNDQPILGQEAIAGKHGLGRITALGPRGRCNPLKHEWIGVTPYVAGYQMNFDPNNVELIPLVRTGR